ncbi:hypothetical protein [Streptomyces sp. Wb2n-11]|uniref:hypothetical protein n=1 Tax=Streptomyces sp. Wb2n-11 TaxID=1030533 RepID=UPI000A44226E|nr:hypothetical protein [Streptomyces sp. Wb2n-11]
MGNSRTEDAAVQAKLAGHRLRLLKEVFVTPPRQADPGRRARASTPSTPIRPGVLDHAAASVDEIITHTRAEVPRVSPAPRNDSVYQWALDNTRHLDPERQRALDAKIYQQSLEHALMMGDDLAIRRHSCPACGCWGLFWMAATQAAGCVNRHCADKDGRPNTWTLQQLAERHVSAANTARRNAT